MKTGAEKQQLKDYKREAKNLSETKEITDHVANMSNDDLDKLLIDNEGTKSNNK